MGSDDKYELAVDMVFDKFTVCEYVNGELIIKRRDNG